MPETAIATSEQTDWLSVAQDIARRYEPPAIGRPSDALTDVYRVHKLLTLIAAGNYLETAARAAGFSKQSLYNWKTQAEAGNVAAIVIVDAMEKAAAQAECETLDHINSAQKRPELWAASMTKLERRHPDRWGKRQDDNSAPKVVVQIGCKDSDVQVTVNTLSPPTFAPSVTE